MVWTEIIAPFLRVSHKRDHPLRHALRQMKIKGRKRCIARKLIQPDF